MRQTVATRPVDGDAGTHGLIYAQALTACFAGPVFNLLVTLGVGFLIRLDNFQERRMRVASNDGISVGLGMIIANWRAASRSSSASSAWGSTCCTS